jgi:hypothetical protein
LLCSAREASLDNLFPFIYLSDSTSAAILCKSSLFELTVYVELTKKSLSDFLCDNWMIILNSKIVRRKDRELSHVSALITVPIRWIVRAKCDRDALIIMNRVDQFALNVRLTGMIMVLIIIVCSLLRTVTS